MPRRGIVVDDIPSNRPVKVGVEAVARHRVGDELTYLTPSLFPFRLLDEQEVNETVTHIHLAATQVVSVDNR